MTRTPDEETPDYVSPNPPGGRGADSGAAPAVDTEGSLPEGSTGVSSQNDIAGVGSRAADGSIESGTADAGDDIEQRGRLAEPGMSRPDENPDVARRNRRVAERDAGSDAAAKVSDPDAQHLPREAQNAPSLSEEVRGIIVQTRADIQLGNAPEGQLRDILARRLRDAGIDQDDRELDSLVHELQNPSDDDTAPGVRP